MPAPKSQNPDRLNYVNIALMLISGLLAWWVPFELFLFAYAVLGPLHYLTEISWLHDRGYFAGVKWEHYALIALAILFSVLVFTHAELTRTNGAMLVLGLALSGLLASTKNARGLVGPVLLAAVILAALLLSPPIALLLGVLIPTLVHVFVFTGAFILAGALKTKSRSGVASLGVFLLVSIALVVVRVPSSGYAISDSVRSIYLPFAGTNGVLLELLRGFPSIARVGFFAPNGESALSQTSIFQIYDLSPLSLSAMRFIAFAYLYHYLNWFSKTSVIGWHRISRKRSIAIVLAWIFSVTLYAINFELGTKVLFVLSILHVYLEFPLNARTFMGLLSFRATASAATALARSR